MDSDEIHALLSCICSNENVDFAVIASDEFDDLSFDKFPLFVVFNESPRSSEGSHWCVALFKKKHHGIECEVFDSFGVKTSQKHIRYNFFVTRENVKQLQSDYSSTCGFWCLYWVHSQLHYISTKRFLAQFTSDLNLNDQIIMRFGKRLRRCCKGDTTSTKRKIGCCSRIAANK